MKEGTANVAYQRVQITFEGMGLPQYFFDTDRGDRICRDGRGLELIDDHAARQETRKYMFDLLYGVPTMGRTIVACVVRDGLGCVVYRVMMTVDGEGERRAALTR